MLYVFHVDVGRMMTFDMTIAMSSVEKLKETIERLHGIPASNIVLLVSGGEMLSECIQVSYYSAGTDTNPIYMFLNGDFKLSPIFSQTDFDLDLSDQVNRCLDLPAIYDTVVKRAQLAAKMCELALDEDRLCERLVHEQHLQQQGWSAVVANMEDLTIEFQQRFDDFCFAFDKHMIERVKYLDLLRSFDDDLKKLARIPILPGLLPMTQNFHGFEAFFDNNYIFPQDDLEEGSATSIVSNTHTSQNNYIPMGNIFIRGENNICTSKNLNDNKSRRCNLSLLQWITSKENSDTLQRMCNECIQSLGTFNEDVYEKLKCEIHNILKVAAQTEVKEIKGLSERLCKLDEFRYKIRSMVQDQKELSTAFQQNQTRAINLRDASILPDLCASHQSQLKVMLLNHQKIREHRRCIAKAKDELGTNLYTRLKRIVWIENAMSDLDNSLLFYHRCLRRAERHIYIIEQIHQAPSFYIAAVTEVVRRKIFSNEFQQWASNLSVDFNSLYYEEISRRQSFNNNFQGHFLNTLFPGMSDMPPSFTNENPLDFDSTLPNIVKSDLDILIMHLPEIISQTVLPDMKPLISFFVLGSSNSKKNSNIKISNQHCALPVNLGNVTQAIIDYKNSITKTLEKIENSDFTDTMTTSSTKDITEVITLQNPNSYDINQKAKLTQSIGTLTESDQIRIPNDVTHLREIIVTLSKLSKMCLKLARSNLQTLRFDITECRTVVQLELQFLMNKCNNIYKQLVKNENRLCEYQTETFNEPIESNQSENNKSTAFQIEYGIFNDTVWDNKKLEHEIQIGGEKSICLEKHERLLKNLVLKLNEEKQAEINTIINKEKTKWLSELKLMESDPAVIHVHILKEMLEEKEQQLEQLREKNLLLIEEKSSLQTRLTSVLNEENNSCLKENIEYLNRDKLRLQEELLWEKSKRLETETSLACLKSSINESQQIQRSKSSGSSHKYIMLESCNIGDLVLVVWSMKHQQFVALQDSSCLYFVHTDSLEDLNLYLPQETKGGTFSSEFPVPYFSIGRIVDKEYCQARKDENRYHVPKGSKFYRIHVASLSLKHLFRRERFEFLFPPMSPELIKCNYECTSTNVLINVLDVTKTNKKESLEECNENSSAVPKIIKNNSPIMEYNNLVVSGSEVTKLSFLSSDPKYVIEDLKHNHEKKNQSVITDDQSNSAKQKPILDMVSSMGSAPLPTIENNETLQNTMFLSTLDSSILPITPSINVTTEGHKYQVTSTKENYSNSSLFNNSQYPSSKDY